MLKMECFGAKNGDCFLIHYGTAHNPRFVLIDCGPGGVYKKVLRPRLADLRDAHADGDPLRIELAMVSHVDQDHILGLLQLTDELIEDADDADDLVDFRRFWHNSFDELAGGTTAGMTAAITSIVASHAGAAVDFADPGDADGRTAPILASIGQGQRLADNLKKLGLDGNQPFNGLVMTGGDAPDAVTLPGDFKITILGPNKQRLDDLREEWAEKLPTITSALELASAARETITNLSSIIALIEHGGRRILLTGDAHGDDVTDGATTRGLLDNGPLHLDIHKLPHHGSHHNVSVDYFRKFPARTYVLSGNGKHDNPEPDTLNMIRQSRSDGDYTVLITNPVEMDTPAKVEPFNDAVKALQDVGATVIFRDLSERSLTIPLA